MRILALSLLCYASAQQLFAISAADHQAMLPPSPFWNDTASMQDFVEDTGDFVTTAESSDFTETATYDQVGDFFTRLADASTFASVSSLATLANGDDIWMVTVSGEESFTPEAMTKPIVYATAGIHAGESMGVNAGMMFLRNLAMKEEYEELLMSVNVLFIPVFNVDGYKRQSANGRLNQFGPNTSGRRANNHNNNLNRDFGKLDSPEVQAIVKVMSDYDISFYIDLHSTDGINYQDDVTWCDNGDAGLSNEIFAWMRNELQGDLEDYLRGYNHSPGPCYLANDSMDPTAGYYPYLSDGAAFSANYADHRQIPGYLLEEHALKPNKQRVLGSVAFLVGVCTVVGQKAESLRAAIEADGAAHIGM